MDLVKSLQEMLFFFTIMHILKVENVCVWDGSLSEMSTNVFKTKTSTQCISPVFPFSILAAASFVS